MKDILFDALMLFVGCLLWIICMVLMVAFYLIVTWIVYQIAEFGNFAVLWLLVALVVLLASIVTMMRVAIDFWYAHCL